MGRITVVTEHPMLVEYIREIGLIEPNEEVEVLKLGGIQLEDIPCLSGAVVIGELPLHLAALAETITMVPLLAVPGELSGRELTLEEIRRYASRPCTYRVRLV